MSNQEDLEKRLSALEEMADSYRKKIVKNKRSNDRLAYALYFLLGVAGVAIISTKYDQELGYQFSVPPELVTSIAGGIGGLAIAGKTYLDAKKDELDQ